MTLLFFDVLKNIKRHPRLFMSTLFVLAISFSTVLTVVSVKLNFARILRSWGEGISVTAFLKEKTAESEIEDLLEKLKLEPGVNKLNFVSKKQALENFKLQMKDLAPGM